MRKKTPQNRRKTGRKPNGQFAPGASGNPGGRPKTKHFSEAARIWLAQTSESDPGQTNAEALANIFGEQALKGDVAAARELVDRAEGKARRQLDIDMTTMDWRELARSNGLDVHDVLDEARRIIAAESADASGDDERPESSLIN